MSQDTLFTQNENKEETAKTVNVDVKLMNIHQRMAFATSYIRTVAKNLNIDIGNCKSYKAVSETDVLKAVKEAEEMFGIYSYPISSKQIECDNRYEVENKYGIKVYFFMRLERTYRFCSIDNPTDYIEVVTYGDGYDSGDKAPGKAMTYADKYALLKAYKINTGDDPDKNASEENIKSTQQESKASESQISIIVDFCNSNAKFIDYMKSKVGDKQPKDLTLKEASELIKAINVKKNG